MKPPPPPPPSCLARDGREPRQARGCVGVMSCAVDAWQDGIISYHYQHKKGRQDQRWAVTLDHREAYLASEGVER